VHHLDVEAMLLASFQDIQAAFFLSKQHGTETVFSVVALIAPFVYGM
jgi:hypothetical protein